MLKNVYAPGSLYCLKAKTRMCLSAEDQLGLSGEYKAETKSHSSKLWETKLRAT